MEEAGQRLLAAILASAVEVRPPAPPAPPAGTAADDGTPPKFALTDVGNGKRLAHRHGKDLRYCHGQDQWYVWDGMRWQPDQTIEIERRAKDTIASILREAAAVADSTERKKTSEWAIASQSAKAVAAMIRMARSEPPIAIRAEELDTDPWSFNCPNGTLDLRTGELGQHRREDMISKLCPVEYHADATCPAWDNFLVRVFAVAPDDPDDTGNRELIDFVQRLFGYCLTGDIRDQIVPIMWGGGSNGKSRFSRVLREVWGDDYSTKAPRKLLMVRRNEQHTAELLTLKGMRLMIATESGQDAALDEELVKDITGDEDLQARGMRENYARPFGPTCKIVLGTNHRPRIVEGGKGTWRRLAILPFGTYFWDPDADETGPAHLCQDKELKGKLRDEYPGILAWFVRGCLSWQKGGMRIPRCVQDQTRVYREEEDWAERFLSECCRRENDSGNTTLKEVFARYLNWCEGNGVKPVGNRKLKAALVGHQIDVRPGTANVVTCYKLDVLPWEPKHKDEQHTSNGDFSLEKMGD